MSSMLQAPGAPASPEASGGVVGPTPQINRILRLARQRMRRNRLLAVASGGLATAATVLLLWVVVARFVAVSRPGVAAVAGVVAAALVAGVAAAAVPMSHGDTAWAADRWLRLPETLATALHVRTAPPSPLAAEHVRRAERVAGDIDRLPDGPRLPVRTLAVAAVIALVAAGLATLSDPQRQARETAARERAAVAAQAEALRDAADDLARSDQPSDREAAEQLRALAEELDGADLETALERLQAAQQRLDARIGNLAAQRTALAGLQRAMQASPLATGDTPAAQLDQLADDLAAGELDADQADQVAERLDQLAQALGGQPQVAQALNSAAAQVGAGTAGAAGALGAAADAVRAAEQHLAGAEASAAVAGSVTSAADALRAAQQGAQPGSGSGQQPGQGQQGQGQAQGQQGQGAGQGRGPGQGSGTQPGSQGQGQGGQGGAGGGQGASASNQPRNGRSGSGGTAGEQPTRDDPRGTLDGQTVYDPTRPQAGPGEDVQIQGQDTGEQPETTKGVSQGLGQRNTALVPYRDVLAEYQQRATHTVEQPGYPVRLRDTVRDYFDGLADPS